jgi:hypothetical protein
MRGLVGTFVTFSFVGVLLLSSSGCVEKSPVKLVTVEGIVRINGKAAPDIMIQLAPDVGLDVDAITSTGTSGADGKFSLNASDGRTGAMPGRSRVVLADLNEERPEQGKPQTAASRIPSRYVSGEALTVDVIEGQLIEIDL